MVSFVCHSPAVQVSAGRAILYRIVCGEVPFWSQYHPFAVCGKLSVTWNFLLLFRHFSLSIIVSFYTYSKKIVAIRELIALRAGCIILMQFNQYILIYTLLIVSVAI
jgi:hypothetical protein